MLGRTAIALLCICGTVFAEAQSVKGPETGRRPGPVRPRSIDERVDSFSKKLGLTGAQRAKVIQITRANDAKLAELAKNSKLRPEDRRVKVESIIKAGQAQIRKVLDSRQRVKYDTIIKDYEASRLKYSKGGIKGTPSRPPQTKKP